MGKEEVGDLRGVGAQGEYDQITHLQSFQRQRGNES